MLRATQIASLTLLTALLVLSTVSAWLGLAPEQSFLDFLKQADALGTLVGVFTIGAAILAFILGWKPDIAFGNWIRARLIVPAFTDLKRVASLSALIAIALLLELAFLKSYREKPHGEIVEAIVAQNFDLADRLIAAADDADATTLADLHIFSDAQRQQYFVSTGNADENICRMYNAYFEKRRLAFQPLWWRLSYRTSRAACFQVVRDPKQALEAYKASMALRGWLAEGETRFISRRMADLYLRDNEGFSDLPEKPARLKYVIALLGTDPDFTASRMRGTAKYLMSNFSGAAAEFEASLAAAPAGDQIERKKLFNNIALSYANLKQYTLAEQKADLGLALAFKVDDEAERREQIRLLATKQEILVQKRQCRGALSIFAQREALKRQERSPCTALLEAQLYACVIDTQDSTTEERARFLDAILFGVEQDSRSFVDRTAPAFVALAEQSASKYANCYVGLTYDTAAIRHAMRRLLPPSAQGAALLE